MATEALAQFTISEMQVNISGVTARLTADSAPLACHVSGWLGGTRSAFRMYQVRALVGEPIYIRLAYHRGRCAASTSRYRQIAQRTGCGL